MKKGVRKLVISRKEVFEGLSMKSAMIGAIGSSTKAL